MAEDVRLGREESLQEPIEDVLERYQAVARMCKTARELEAQARIIHSGINQLKPGELAIPDGGRLIVSQSQGDGHGLTVQKWLPGFGSYEEAGWDSVYPFEFKPELGFGRSDDTEPRPYFVGRSVKVDEETVWFYNDDGTVRVAWSEGVEVELDTDN